LQSRTIEDDAALNAIKEGQNRVDSMGLIHQKLYMGEHLATVDIKDYLQNLSNNLLDAFGIYDDRIEFEYQIADLRLDIDTAIPLGLIVNELLTNTLKYAFPDQQSGTITIGLYEENDTLQLVVQDDGVGAAASNATPKSNSTSFGSKLVRMFSEKLEGEVEIFKPERGYGTRIQIHQYQLVK
jgi:two-component sensor histidine kinase